MGFIALVVPACKDDEDVDEAQVLKEMLEKQDQQIAAHLSQNGISAEKDTRGIYRQVVQANPDGEIIEEGDVAVVHYRMSLLDGTTIGTSKPGPPVLITYSPARLYFPSVLRYGLSYMKAGETYRFYVPSPYALGKFEEKGKIPANSIIVLEYEVLDVYHSLEEIFEVEQVNIQSWLEAENRTAVELPGGLHKVVLNEGTGEMPVNGEEVKVYYKGYFLNKEVFDENLSGDGFSFKLGANAVVKGFEQAVKSMKVGEKALFILPSELAYGRNGGFVLPREYISKFKEAGQLNSSVSTIPPFSTLVFELELLSKK